MRRWLRIGFSLFLTVNLAIFVTVGPILALLDGPPALFSGLTQINGPLHLAVLFDPPVATPGQTITAILTLTNDTRDAAAPSIDILIPPTLTLDVTRLPIGLSLNAQANLLTWLPIVTGNGDREQIRLYFTAAFADVQQPEQPLAITMQHGAITQNLAATLWLGIPPQVTLLPLESVAVGQPITLRATLSGPGPLAQTWDLGDGRVIQAQNPTVVFPTAGLHRITVRVANPLAAATATTLLNVTAAPTAQFTTNDLTPVVGQTIQFINQSGGAGPLTYTWEFGDGAISEAQTPQHSYNQPGTYLVRLMVQNEAGVAEITQPLIVGELPIADFVVSQPITAGLPMFVQAFVDPSVTHVTWNLGDGHTAEGLTISHTYQHGGNYWVILQAHNQFGTTDVGQWVTAISGPSTIFLPLFFSGDLSGADPTEVTPDQPDNEIIITDSPPLDSGFTTAEQLLWYINEARRLHNLPPLNYSYELAIAAQQHSDDMALYGYTGHTGSDGSRPEERQAQFGFAGLYAGEVTYWGFDEVTAVVEFWVNSPAHRSMILDSRTTDVGVGYTYNPNSPSVWYWVAEFGITAPPLPEPSPETRLDFELRHPHLSRHLKPTSETA